MCPQFFGVIIAPLFEIPYPELRLKLLENFLIVLYMMRCGKRRNYRRLA
jgi:hypothetical protein